MLIYSLVFSDEAKEDIDNINLYTFTTWGAYQADIYMEFLEKAFQGIARNSSIGRNREDLPKRFKGYNAGKHVIFYRVDDKIIHIIRVLHESMSFSKHLNP